jgi:hypothetical protein
VPDAIPLHITASETHNPQHPMLAARRNALDEYISPEVADGQQTSGIFLSQEASIFPFRHTMNDQRPIAEAAKRRLTLVTYDRRTIPPLLKLWAEEGREHGGVMFVDEKTISPADIGGLIRALAQVSKEAGKWDWTGRVYFLRCRL